MEYTEAGIQIMAERRKLLKKKRELTKGDVVFIEAEHPLEFIACQQITRRQGNVPLFCRLPAELLNLFPDKGVYARMFLHQHAAPARVMM